MEGALVRGLVANVERELFLLRLGFAGRFLAVEAHVLQQNGALLEPVVLGHVIDEDLLGGGGGLVLVAQAVRSLSNSARSSQARTVKRAPVSPNLVLFRQEMARPSGLVGPVEDWALARLMARRRSLTRDFGGLRCVEAQQAGAEGVVVGSLRASYSPVIA